MRETFEREMDEERARNGETIGALTEELETCKKDLAEVCLRFAVIAMTKRPVCAAKCFDANRVVK